MSLSGDANCRHCTCTCKSLSVRKKGKTIFVRFRNPSPRLCWDLRPARSIKNTPATTLCEIYISSIVLHGIFEVYYHYSLFGMEDRSESVKKQFLLKYVLVFCKSRARGGGGGGFRKTNLQETHKLTSHVFIKAVLGTWSCDLAKQLYILGTVETQLWPTAEISPDSWGFIWQLGPHMTAGTSPDSWILTWQLGPHLTARASPDSWGLTWRPHLTTSPNGLTWRPGPHLTAGASPNSWVLTWQLNILGHSSILSPHQTTIFQIINQQLVQAGVRVQIHQEVLILLHLQVQ